MYWFQGDCAEHPLLTQSSVYRRYCARQKGKGRAAYGKEILKSLAERLTAEFGKGFSQTNLKLMRQFYIQNQDRIGQSLTDQLAGALKPGQFANSDASSTAVCTSVWP
jgi:hypothetical protein